MWSVINQVTRFPLCPSCSALSPPDWFTSLEGLSSQGHVIATQPRSYIFSLQMLWERTNIFHRCSPQKFHGNLLVHMPTPSPGTWPRRSVPYADWVRPGSGAVSVHSALPKPLGTGMGGGRDLKVAARKGVMGAEGFRPWVFPLGSA